MSWELLRLDDVCEIIGGTTPRTNNPDYWNGDIVWLSPVDLPEIGTITSVLDSGRKITELAVKESGLRILPVNTVVFSTRASIGKIGIVGTPLTINQGFNSLIPSNKVDSLFLAYALKSNIENISQLGNSTTFKEVSRSSFKEFKIPIPPLSTQKRIAKILDTADALRRKDQELLRKYDELAQAIFIDMFGDPMRNEKGWEIRPIKSIAAASKNSIKAGPFGSSLKKEFYVKEGYKIYGQEQVIKDDLSFGDYYISEEKFRELINCKIASGDVLISLVGTYGKISVVPETFEPGIINPRLMKIGLNKTIMNPYFLKFLLQTESMINHISQFSRGGTMDIVNVGIMSGICVIVPPIKMQIKFIDIIENIKSQSSNLKSNNSDYLFQSLLQKAFKAELIS